MWKKLLIISLCVSVFLVLSANVSPANAGSKKVNWKVAGSIANYVGVVTSFSPFTITPHYLINLSATGTPGPAEITLMGVGIPEDPPDETDDCDSKIIIIQNQMVARFPDLSLLFASHDNVKGGYLCQNEGEDTFFETNMIITGGTGRFEGASGEITGNGYSHSALSGGPLSAETAQIKGTINYSD